jgi:carboxypeptidase PM20D1
MKIFGGLALVLVAAFAAVVAVIAVRTARYEPPGVADGREIKVAAPIPVDVAAAAQHLSQAVQIQTVTHQDPAEDQAAEWEKLHALLETSYPTAHAAMTRTIVGRNTLIYVWKGSDASLAPVILMAHQDVVPVTPGTEKDWKYPPFSGAIAEGAVWGRGSIDDKGSLITLFEGVEALAKTGFQPRRTVILVSGEDEEVRGDGAKSAAAWLKAQGIRAEFVIDEGQAVIAKNPVTGGRLALIGTAEKGYATLRITARAPGGHSSAPPADGGGVATLAKAIVAIVDKPFPMAFRGPGAAMLQTLAPSAALPVRVAVANTWLFKPMLVKQTAATPAGAALLHTTIAPTMLKGSPKENVLPQDATAWINYRIAPGDSSATVMARAREAVGTLPVRLGFDRAPSEPSPVSSMTSEGWKTIAAVARASTGAAVAPGLVTAGTDSRYLQPVAQDVYRFQPMEFGLSDIEMIHGTNEHMTLKNLAQAVQFYGRLIETAAQ